jgi:dipeptidyl aminopeptidase/acylaminoacyl peptidase
MKRIHVVIAAVVLLAGCGLQDKPETASLPEARKGFETKLVSRGSDKIPVDQPPPHVFRIVHYDSPMGKLPAYLSPDPQDGQKHPAIVWITGGDCNTIGDVWSEASPDNDQTASAYRMAGIPMMFPSLRGGNDNPGQKEGFFGEVDDVLAAADYLSQQPFVDPQRIYLGGHSTGGTLVLLVAAASDRFRAVFSFGPVDDVSGYGLNSEYLPFDTWSRREIQLRSPIRWLHSVKSPLFVLEGNDGNIDCLHAMKRRSKNPLVHCLAVKGTDHFGILAPVNALIAGKVAGDTGDKTNLSFSEAELSALFGR